MGSRREPRTHRVAVLIQKMLQAQAQVNADKAGNASLASALGFSLTIVPLCLAAPRGNLARTDTLPESYKYRSNMSITIVLFGSFQIGYFFAEAP